MCRIWSVSKRTYTCLLCLWFARAPGVQPRRLVPSAVMVASADRRRSPGALRAGRIPGRLLSESIFSDRSATTAGPHRLGNFSRPRLPASGQRQRGGARGCLLASGQRQHTQSSLNGPPSRPLQLVPPGEPGAVTTGCLPAPGQRQHAHYFNPGPRRPGIPRHRARFHANPTTPRAPGFYHLGEQFSTLAKTAVVGQPPTPCSERLDSPSHPSSCPPRV